MSLYVAVAGERFQLEKYEYNDYVYLTLTIPASEDYATVKNAFKENTGDISIYDESVLVKTFKDLNKLVQIIDDMEYYYIDLNVDYEDQEALTILASSRIGVSTAVELRASLEALASDLPDEQAIDDVWMFPKWAVGVQYKVDDRVQYETLLYRCILAHTSQADWTPDKAPSLFVNISDPTVEWPEWKQPLGSEDAYKEGDKVSHNNKHWISNANYNVWEPGVYGWDEVPEE